MFVRQHTQPLLATIWDTLLTLIIQKKVIARLYFGVLYVKFDLHGSSF